LPALKTTLHCVVTKTGAARGNFVEEGMRPAYRTVGLRQAGFAEFSLAVTTPEISGFFVWAMHECGSPKQ
jgi:hypothetical protein